MWCFAFSQEAAHEATICRLGMSPDLVRCLAPHWTQCRHVNTPECAGQYWCADCVPKAAKASSNTCCCLHSGTGCRHSSRAGRHARQPTPERRGPSKGAWAPLPAAPGSCSCSRSCCPCAGPCGSAGAGPGGGRGGAASSSAACPASSPQSGHQASCRWRHAPQGYCRSPPES